MSPESMDSQAGGEYDATKRMTLRQRLGAFVARHLIQGDDDVARGIRNSGLGTEAEVALVGILDAEFASALTRAQSLLVSVRESRLPAYLLDDDTLSDALADELQEAVREWGVSCADRLAEIEEYTTACAAHPDDVDPEGKYNFCAHVTYAENHLRRELYGRFRPDLSS